MKCTEPILITCVTGRGDRANVAFRFDGIQHVHIHDPIINQQRVEKFRRYRVFIEVPWEHSQITQIAVVGWPDDVTFIFDVPGLTEEQGITWAQGIDIREIVSPFNTIGNANAN